VVDEEGHPIDRALLQPLQPEAEQPPPQESKPEEIATPQA
jgi:hypothetical protein